VFTGKAFYFIQEDLRKIHWRGASRIIGFDNECKGGALRASKRIAANQGVFDQTQAALPRA